MDGSVAGILGEIAAKFPATESTISIMGLGNVDLIMASARRVAFVVSNTTNMDIYISTDGGDENPSGWVIGPQSIEKFLAKDLGGLVMMPWVLKDNNKVPFDITVFEVYSTG